VAIVSPLKWMKFGVEFLKNKYISLEIWVSAPYGDFLLKKKRLEHIHIIPHVGVPPKIIPT
jgi:hypothetical protein